MRNKGMGARRLKQKEQGKFSFTEMLGSLYFKSTVAGLLLISSVLALAKLYQPTTLPFKSIQVYGELSWIDRKKLNALIIEKIDGGFFSLNISQLKSTLEQQAWIESVAIRRVWPDVLQITANEQQPIAVWNGSSVINRHGELFDPADQGIPKYLVKVSGPEGSHQLMMNHYFAIEKLFQEAGLRVASMDINDRRALQVILTNGVRLLLGRVRNEEESVEEVHRFVAAYKGTLSPKFDEVALVDLRYTNGLAVRWKQHTTTQQQTLGAISRSMVQG